MKKINKVFVFHIGARDKYAIAVFFQKKKLLQSFITDYWIPQTKNIITLFFPNKATRRYHSDLNQQCIHYNHFLKFHALLISQTKKNIFNRWIKGGSLFSRFVIEKISKQRIIKNETVILWGYTAGNMEVLNHFKNHTNFIKIHNQIDPGVTYYETQKQLQERFPKLEKKRKTFNNTTHFSEFITRIKEEWRLADIIVVNSNFSKSCIIKNGADPNKIIVLPLIYDKENENIKRKPNKNRKITVGFVGNINLIKGFYLYYEVAKVLSGRMSFIAAGNSYFNDKFMEEASNYISFKGHLPLKEMEKLYQEIDILVFPTYCDGFGMVQLEAMSHGIPVIASKYCGEVVEDSINGFLVKNEANNIIKYLKLLDVNRDLLEKLSNATKSRIKDYSHTKFEEKLIKALQDKNISL